jgi:hypothetical protein
LGLFEIATGQGNEILQHVDAFLFLSIVQELFFNRFCDQFRSYVGTDFVFLRAGPVAGGGRARGA